MFETKLSLFAAPHRMIETCEFIDGRGAGRGRCQLSASPIVPCELALIAGQFVRWATDGGGSPVGHMLLGGS
jgi:hypothetical protein